ncbi:TraR/DksA family transcriptional regulator [Halomonas venusta]|uniref:TraR/DksA family transcriptional regulator n=1 Tax=Vreelandella venusta TaxID=44935 RepID=UPI00295F228E|nr:TraR/DksA family transcriptional regulator [Halomonas venusta]MDW0359597.1 TraR/DksA family transcriptional regulator [Halomonas venusta]
MSHTDVETAAISQKLLALEVSLREESIESASSRETVVLDQTSVGRLSRMDALRGQAMAKGKGQRAKAEEQRRQMMLKFIGGALQRIEQETLASASSVANGWVTNASPETR